MKMIKQNIYTALFTGISHVTSRITYQNNYFLKIRKEANLLHWIQRTYTAAPAKTRQLVKLWLTSHLDGQIISQEDYNSKGYSVHPYNFLPSPQSLYLLPGSYRKNKPVKEESHKVTSSSKP
jgi:hypothetical protein